MSTIVGLAAVALLALGLGRQRKLGRPMVLSGALGPLFCQFPA